VPGKRSPLHDKEVATAGTAPPAAPRPPRQDEKYLYLHRRAWLIVPGSMVAIGCAAWSGYHLLLLVPTLRIFTPGIVLGLLYALVSLRVNTFLRGGFDFPRHQRLVRRWARQAQYAGIDILLPTAGEEIVVLGNTWNGVRTLRDRHVTGGGECEVVVLDDAARPEVAALASIYHFRYTVRDDRPNYKKAGNLRHGYRITHHLHHQFVVIFDADFRPSVDFFRELLPYFYDDATIGIVQSPQYFDVTGAQIWLQRGAGAVQEFFYRYGQVARQAHNGAICVGTNAIYRRMALDAAGGPALIGHSEDVHTGFNMRRVGYHLKYVPIVLAKGVCPEGMESFWKQQYRWCMGSMSLLFSHKFWSTRTGPLAGMCYWSGFLYYITTGTALLWSSLVPLALLASAPQVVAVTGYAVIFPSVFYSFVLWPKWHHCDYGTDAWAVRHIYSWAHLFAFVDALRRRPMGWSPTGISGGSGWRYPTYRVLQVVVSFVPSLAWASFALLRLSGVVAGTLALTIAAPRAAAGVFTSTLTFSWPSALSAWTLQWQFLPLLAAGVFVAYTTGRVSFYRYKRSVKQQRYHLTTGAPTGQMSAIRLRRPGGGFGAGV
jgi:cellulose synthase (UDP-forming)